MDQKIEIDELEKEIESVKARILKYSREVLQILDDDLKKFVEREIKKQFLRFPFFSESLSKDQIKAIKEEIKQKTQPVVERIIDAMKNQDLWLKGLEYEKGEKSLMENHDLWTRVSPVEELTMEMLRKYKFPESENIKIEYKQPTWFISSKFLPGIAEKYWKSIKEIKEILAKIEELKADRIKETLSKKWDDV
jgi:sugar-specific transcriptional regulator TrmB